MEKRQVFFFFSRSHLYPFCSTVFFDRLRGTTAGANNRMDLLSLVTSGVDSNEVGGPEEDILGVVEGWQDDETHNPDVPAVSHKRGLTPFVFVPFEEVKFLFPCTVPHEK